jgi:hypothetical protein
MGVYALRTTLRADRGIQIEGKGKIAYAEQLAFLNQLSFSLQWFFGLDSSSGYRLSSPSYIRDSPYYGIYRPALVGPTGGLR